MNNSLMTVSQQYVVRVSGLRQLSWLVVAFVICPAPLSFVEFQCGLGVAF